jgi:hypothetical protein
MNAGSDMADHNEVESALERAASDPASRPDFFRVLLESEVFIIGRSKDAGAKIDIVHWQKKDGTPVVPFFSSVDALRRSLKETADYVSLPARSFFELVKGKTLVLNPASSHSKEFFPNEIESLLATGVNNAPVQRTVGKGAQVLLGQPRDYPTFMVAALKKILVKHANVRAAYLCQMHEPTAQAPSLVIGLLADGDVSRAITEAGAVAADTAPRGTAVDLVKVVRGEAGLSAYFLKNVEPFHRRTLGASIKRFFAGGK